MHVLCLEGCLFFERSESTIHLIHFFSPITQFASVLANCVIGEGDQGESIYLGNDFQKCYHLAFVDKSLVGKLSCEYWLLDSTLASP